MTLWGSDVILPLPNAPGVASRVNRERGRGQDDESRVGHRWRCQPTSTIVYGCYLPSVHPKSGSKIERQAFWIALIQPGIVAQAGFNRIGGSSCLPFRKCRMASLRMRYHFRSGSNCSAFFLKPDRKAAMR